MEGSLEEFVWEFKDIMEIPDQKEKFFNFVETFDKSEACEGINITFEEFATSCRHIGLNPNKH